MRTNPYRSFSLQSRVESAQKGRVDSSQFELTHSCGLHCTHCYTECFNTAAARRKELRTRQVTHILDRLSDDGILWLCLTGGDPLVRPDFRAIYRYAKRKGFIVTVFTNGYSMTTPMSLFLKDNPPFMVEMTLNAVTQDVFERITHVRGSFRRVFAGIDTMRRQGLPLSIKTQITKENFFQRDLIRKRITAWGLRFQPSALLYPRLDGDRTPCAVRLGRAEIASLDARAGLSAGKSAALPRGRSQPDTGRNKAAGHGAQPLFRCAVQNRISINVDPHGNAFQCFLIRQPKVNLGRVSVPEAMRKLNAFLVRNTGSVPSPCTRCSFAAYCRNCPGQSYLEKGSLGAKIEYYCRLAPLEAALRKT